jgi:hypothetical protein
VNGFREFVEAVRPGRVWEAAAVGSLAVWSWVEFALTGDLWGLGGGVAFAAAAVMLGLNARRKR